MSPDESRRHLAGLDASQLAAVLAQGNCIVTAGAGAGKTSVLTARFLDLVLGRGLPLRSVLALTFTKKAAAEMYERIYAGLAEEDSPWAKAQRADFKNAHITTLDSFCSELTRSSASTWGYTKEFAIDEEKTRDIAAVLARDYVVVNRLKPGLSELLRAFPLEAVSTQFFAAAGCKFVSPLRLLGPTFIPMGPSLEAEADRLAASLAEQLAGLSRDILAAGKGIPSPGADCLAAIQAADRFLQAADARPLRFRDLDRVKSELAGMAELGMRAYRKSPEETAVKGLAKDLKKAAKDLGDLASYREIFPSHLALLERLDEYALELAESKRLADLMDYKDLGICAVQALKTQPDLRGAWKSRFSSILIDEFQDNNSLQKELLFLLAERGDRSAPGLPRAEELEEGKLFLVGDEKQSIYKFRGADVSVFKGLSAELAAGGVGEKPASLSLSSNYRSRLELIDFFNRLFSLVMNADDGPGKPLFSASYSPMSVGLKEPPAFPSQIRRFELEAQSDEEDEEEDASPSKADELEPDDMLAFSVVRFIRDSVGKLETRRGKAEFGDFAVLLKTTTNQHRLEKYFRLMGIPFESESPKDLFRESPANDLYAALSLVLDPDDRAAYAAVLRGPLCKISDQGFLSLMTEKARPFEHEGPAPLSAPDAEALAKAGSFFVLLKEKAESATASEFLDFLWREGGLRASILATPSAHSFLEQYDYLFRLAASVDGRGEGPEGFHALLRPYIEGSEEGLDVENVPRAAGGGVRLLSVHKAKGLQFPIVVLPWIENALALRRENSLWYPFGSGLAIDERPFDSPGAKSSNVFFRLAKEIERAKNEAELKRLFYVACTRAEDHLFFFGKKPKKETAGASSFRSLLESFVEAGGVLDQVILAPVGKDEVRSSLSLAKRPRLEDFAAAYRALPSPIESWPRALFGAAELSRASPREEQRTSPHAGAEERAAGGAAPAGVEPTVFGDLCHAAVEYAVARGSAEGFQPPPPLLQRLPSEALGRALALARSYAQGFLDGPFWREMAAAGKPELEKPFLLALGEVVVEGRMDFWLETEEGIIVLDFKSDASPDPTPYSTQLTLYTMAASELRTGKPVRTGIYWLRTGQMTWMDELLVDEKRLIWAVDSLRKEGEHER